MSTEICKYIFNEICWLDETRQMYLIHGMRKKQRKKKIRMQEEEKKKKTIRGTEQEKRRGGGGNHSTLYINIYERATK